MDLELVGSLCGFFAALASWAMAAFVYVAAPSRAQNRLTALFLALVGFQVGATFGVFGPFEVYRSPLGGVAMTAALAQSTVYLALLGTLDSPLSRAFAGPRARLALLAVSAAIVAGWPLYARSLLMPDGPALPPYWALLFAHGLALLYGFVVALSAWRRAPPASAARARGRAFTFAFGVRDVVFFVFIAVIVFAQTSSEPDPDGFFRLVWVPLQNIFVPLSVIAMVLLMGYGMAKAQLFEVDLKIKTGVRRGAVAGAFLAVFLVVSQLIEGFSSQTFGLVGGALASGALLLGLAPLQRAAERLSGVVVPDARPLAERAADERAELYREQVRIAWEDGRLGLKERRMLDAARERLGLAADVAVHLEGEVTRSIATSGA